MIRTTPFHPRLSELNTEQLFTHWQGFLSPLRYSHAPKHEYFAVRNSVGVFDTSPLFKYRMPGRDAEKLLAGVHRARHPHLPAGPGAVHGVVRRPRLRDGGRRRLPALRRRLPAHRRAPQLLAGAAPRPAARRDRGRHRRLRHPRRPRPAVARGPRAADARGRVARVLRAHAGEDRRHRGHGLPHRLHR